MGFDDYLVNTYEDEYEEGTQDNTLVNAGPNLNTDRQLIGIDACQIYTGAVNNNNEGGTQ